MAGMPTPTRTRIEVACACGFRARVSEELAGRRVKCKRCGSRLVVGGDGPPPAPAAPRPVSRGPAPKLGRSEKNVVIGGLVLLWGLGAALYGYGRASAAAGGGPEIVGVFMAAVVALVVLVPLGLRTIAFGLRPIHVRGQDAIFAPTKVAVGALVLLCSALIAIEAAAALPSADGSRPAVVLAVSLAVAVGSGLLASNGVRALRAAASDPAGDAPAV